MGVLDHTQVFNCETQKNTRFDRKPRLNSRCVQFDVLMKHAENWAFGSMGLATNWRNRSQSLCISAIVKVT